MQSRGAIRFVTIIVLLACLYQLSFTLATRLVEGKAKNYAEAKSLQAQGTEAYKNLPDNRKRAYADSIAGVAESYYLDSVATESAYPFGIFTYKEVKEKEISLGLDLKGGMNVTLEVSVIDMIKAMAGKNADDPTFISALELARKNQGGSGKGFVELFGEAWNTVASGDRLSRIFGTYDLRDRVRPETANEEVLKIINDDAQAAINNSFNVLRNRIDRFGVTSPTIQRLGNTGRILVELPGVKEPERVRKLLQGTASLEFWAVYNNLPYGADPGMYDGLARANQIIRDINSRTIDDPADVADVDVDTDDTTTATADAEVVDSTQTDDLLAQIESQQDSIAAQREYEEMFPLFAVLHPSVDQNGKPFQTPTLGRAHYRDTAKINAWLEMDEIRNLFPASFSPAWTVKADAQTGSYFDLIGLKKNTQDGKAPLDGGAIVDAYKNFNPATGTPEVSMTMNSDGSRDWARLTADNIGSHVAIVLDGYVYSYPTVENEITGGSSVIRGQFSVQEADDLVNVLKSGKLPVPARIVQEAVVGPSLGAESINAGMISFVIAFLLVLIYMWAYYGKAGLIADIALFTNVILLFGTLVSFGAVLTLPGIAGIVLSLGMAVDANVLIYERIKEEIRAGKSQRIAVTEGYKNALSAIIDGQLTTMITGIVLFIFGSGPVQGFATTLIIGIITSLFTSIFVSRLVIERVLDKGKNISYGNKYTINMLANTKFDFLKVRKYTYIISTIVVAIGLTFIFTKGFSFGVDFSGGRSYTIRFDQEARTNEVRQAVIDKFETASEVKQFGPSNQVKITTKYKIEDRFQGEEVDREVELMLYDALKDFYETPLTFDEFVSTQTNPNGITASDKVGPTIADDLKVKAVFAVLLSLVAIFIYVAVRFKKWQWGFGGVLSLAHDAAITISIFSIFSGILPFTLDLDQQFIAAVLTIIGYSINDAVVVFDRVREYQRLYPKRELYVNINEALNSTLMRTINTSGTVLVVLIAIFIFGGEVIRGFSFALIIGIVVGAYSTLYIAIPVAYDLLKKKQNKRIAAKK
ncbi:MAG: protein translocase subunit SecDF [Prevotellaceae bacterium]|jgi:SecD/SecF fusion protein|nr:protein translocase subunit SecDF [Prevotellaceae bacterium]